MKRKNNKLLVKSDKRMPFMFQRMGKSQRGICELHLCNEYIFRIHKGTVFRIYKELLPIKTKVQASIAIAQNNVPMASKHV